MKKILICTCFILMSSAQGASFFDRIRSLSQGLIGEKWTKKIFSSEKPSSQNPLGVREDSQDDPQKAIDPKKRREVLNQERIQDLELKKKLDRSYLRELYFVVFRENISSENEGQWLNALNQGASREGVYRAFIAQEKYYFKEQERSSPPRKMILTFRELGKNFFDLEVTSAQLSEFGIFSVKRECAELGLEVIEKLALDPPKLYQWYGNISAYLARFQTFQSQLRLDPSPQKHENWATKVPLQHLKGEWVIKSHRLWNSLIP